MELEVGLKFSRVVDDSSSAEFKIAKDHAGPVFFSRETDFIFILTAHLKGYQKQNVKIDINEDGTRLTIKGEKQVQETILVGWRLYKKDTEVKSFRKVFRIPEEVILDKIKADFNEDESILRISMPKKIKGIRGTGIEEVKEHDVVKEGPRDDQPLSQEREEPETSSKSDEAQSLAKHKEKEEIHRAETEITGELENKEGKHTEAVDDAERSGIKQVANEDQQEKSDVCENENGIQEEVCGEIQQPEMTQESEVERKVEEKPGKRSITKLCIPCVAGSALILSFVVFVIQLIRTRNQENKRKI